jgi:predicted NACHT family NTPase
MPAEPNPPEKPSIEKPVLSDKIADILLKVVMTGGVAGGGLGAVWSLFKESDVPKAIASAVIGLGLSYAAKMLQPIHKGNEARLEKLGNAANRGLDRMGEAVVAKVLSLEDRYFAAQAAECETCSTEGMAKISGIFTPMLEQVFVPLEFDRSALLPGFAGTEPMAPNLEMDVEKWRAVSIWDLLSRANRDAVYQEIAILAWGGYGKTTLLRHIAYSLGRNKQPQNVPRLIPVLLLLRKYRGILTQDNPPSLPELIMMHHLKSLPEADGLKLPTDWAKNMLKQGKVLVMLDGFDEVPKKDRPLVARWVNTQRRAYKRSIFILTARPKAYNEQAPVDRIDFNTLLYVKKFNEQQRETFVQQWYWCQEYYHHGRVDIPAVRKAAQDAATDLLQQINQRQELADLSTNPLLLNMIAMFHRRYPSAKLPKRRVELYQEICLLQLRDRPGAREQGWLAEEDAPATAQMVLQMLALEMMQQKEERVERQLLLKRLEGYLREQEESIGATEFLQQIEQISELLVQREPDEFEFPHLSFQEYLAAKEVVRLNQESLLYDHFGEDWWKSVTLLYVAQVKKPSGLIRAALERGAKEWAYACWQETSRRIDEDLKGELSEIQALQQEAVAVQRSLYAELESYLKNQQWVEADQETYRLMITAVGKEEGQWFEEEELLNFPCDALRAIDGLWVKYSQGRFGFSVQKQIYVECGGKLDGEEPSQKVWEVFGDRVGWKQNGNWMNYTEVSKQISLSSPKGIFPGLWGGYGGVVGFRFRNFGWWGSLLSHEHL